MFRPILILAMLLAGFTPVAAEPEKPVSPCQSRSFAGADYILCSLDPAKADLRLFWKDAGGKPYRRFSGVADALAGTGKQLLFAMNAGMYREDFTPMGLYVEDGHALVPANTQAPPATSGQIPNFFKKGNGIFYLDASGPHIVATEAYLKQPPQPRLATQSGPMLVTEGKINPIFIPGSTDRTRRNGVGISADGRLHFVISDGSVNFHDFATFFRDGLTCDNALFLDGGNGTGLYDPARGRSDTSWHGGYGPIFGLVGGVD
jgi:uncharacterized protein YigE (DUF2233 family)